VNQDKGLPVDQVANQVHQNNEPQVDQPNGSPVNQEKGCSVSIKENCLNFCC